eukprot:gene6025-3818_t
MVQRRVSAPGTRPLTCGGPGQGVGTASGPTELGLRTRAVQGVDTVAEPKETVNVPTRTVMYRVGRFFVRSSSDVRTLPLEEEEEEECSETPAAVLSMQSSCDASNQSCFGEVMLDRPKPDSKLRPMSSWVGCTGLNLAENVALNPVSLDLLGNVRPASDMDCSVWNAEIAREALRPDLAAGQQQEGQQVVNKTRKYSRGRFNVVEDNSLFIPDSSFGAEGSLFSPTSVLSPTAHPPASIAPGLQPLRNSLSCQPLAFVATTLQPAHNSLAGEPHASMASLSRPLLKSLSVNPPGSPPLSAPLTLPQPPRNIASGIPPSPGVQVRKVGRFTLTEPLPPQTAIARTSPGTSSECHPGLVSAGPLPQLAMSTRTSIGGASDCYGGSNLTSSVTPLGERPSVSVPAAPLGSAPPGPSMLSPDARPGALVAEMSAPALSPVARSGALVAETSAPELDPTRKPARKGRFMVEANTTGGREKSAPELNPARKPLWLLRCLCGELAAFAVN